MSRVIVIERCKQDISNAEQFGPLVYLFGPRSSRPGIWSPGFIPACKRELDYIEFNADTDRLLIAGAVVPLVSVVAYLVNKHGAIWTLGHHYLTNEYTLQKVGEDV